MSIFVYGFGSYFTLANEFSDIDLLLLHTDRSMDSIKAAIEVKKQLLQSISQADVTILSKAEEANAGFCKTSNAVLLSQFEYSNLLEGIQSVLEEVEKHAKDE